MEGEETAMRLFGVLLVSTALGAAVAASGPALAFGGGHGGGFGGCRNDHDKRGQEMALTRSFKELVQKRGCSPPTALSRSMSRCWRCVVQSVSRIASTVAAPNTSALRPR